MTYRTVPRDVSLQMTRDAESHAIDVVHLEDLGHALDLSMTGAAGIGSQRLDMSLMREVGVAGQVGNPEPLDRFLVGPCLTDLLDLGLMGAVAAPDHQVTSHAGLHRGNPGLGRHGHRVVAVLTLDLVLAGVDVVPKEDRLARSAKT